MSFFVGLRLIACSPCAIRDGYCRATVVHLRTDMMHSRSILAVIIVVVGVFFFFGCQEEPADATAPAAPRAVQASEQPGPAPFIVTTSGTVERLEDGCESEHPDLSQGSIVHLGDTGDEGARLDYH